MKIWVSSHGAKVGRKVYIVRNSSTHQPDLWPGDVLWADSLTMLGYVDRNGDFVANTDALLS